MYSVYLPVLEAVSSIIRESSGRPPVNALSVSLMSATLSCNRHIFDIGLVYKHDVAFFLNTV